MSHYFEEKDFIPDYPIDLVYTWVDGNDPEWQKKKNFYLRQSGKVVSDAVNGRFDNHNELLYSLRSVAKFMPWLHHIYLVTDHQVPQFLNLDNPKISIVDHTEIYDNPSVLPTFNSLSIELRLPFVPGLSEHFIYSNDDFFLMRPVTPSFFYAADGKPVIRVWENKIFINHPNWYEDAEYAKLFRANQESPWMQEMLYANKLMYDLFGNKYDNVPYHGFDPYLKSSFLKNLEEPLLQEKIHQTLGNRFRSGEDFARHIFMLFDHVRGRNHLIMRQKYERYLKVLHFPYEIQIVDNEKNMDLVLYWLRPYEFCVYDGDHCTENYKRRIPDFLNRIFPEKCEFER